MTDLDLYDISERFVELVNPTSPEKVIRVGEAAGLAPGQRVIEFGAGYGEVLALWAERFGIFGVGVEVRPAACRRAWAKMVERGVAEQIEIIEGDGAQCALDPGSFDVAACVGAGFIFGGFRETVPALARMVRPGGRLIIGEPYWKSRFVPPEVVADEGYPVLHEHELFDVANEAGFELEFVARASEDDWDRYEATNWLGLARWLEENPDHPDRARVLGRLRGSQREYTRHGREFLGWALYVLGPSAG
jgi:SAM-dependent methyltransferase